MTTAIKPPFSPLLPPAANELYVADGWSNSLGSAPVFSTELRVRTDEGFTPLGGQPVAMTTDQWENWAVDADDQEYILDCITVNMGLTRA